MAALCSFAAASPLIHVQSLSVHPHHHVEASGRAGTQVMRSVACVATAASTSYYVSSDRTLQGFQDSWDARRIAAVSPHLRRRHVKLTLAPWPCGARRKASGTTKVEQEVLIDEDLRTGLNETVTEALKVMLAEDDKLLEKFKEKLDFLGEFLVQDGQIEAARFMLVLRGMLHHELYPEKDELQGPYKKAFDTLWGLLEDSGWLLTQPGAEGGEVPMVDDEIIPPVLQIKYSESS